MFGRILYKDKPKKKFNENKKGYILILFALSCGLLAALIIFVTGSKMLPSIQALEVVKPIEKGTPLDRTYFKEVKLPEAGLPEGVINPNVDLSGMIASRDMIPGDILRHQGVLELDGTDLSVLSARLRALNNPNLRGVEIPINSVKGMLYGINSGDKLDVIAVYDQEKMTCSNGTCSDDVGLIAKTILENVPIIGVKKSEDNNDTSNMSLVIAITQEQAEELALYKTISEIYVSLRPIDLPEKGGE